MAQHIGPWVSFKEFFDMSHIGCQFRGILLHDTNVLAQICRQVKGHIINIKPVLVTIMHGHISVLGLIDNRVSHA